MLFGKRGVGVAAVAVAAGIGLTGSSLASADPLADVGAATLQTLLNLSGTTTGQSAYPFAIADDPNGVAVENGDIYVVDSRKKTVLKLAAGTSVPGTLPFGELSHAPALAVENGDVYVVDQTRVLKLAARSSVPTVLPLPTLNQPLGIAVDNGDVYVADTFNERVLKLPAGGGVPVELPFRGLDGGPVSIAVENGDVYINDMYSKRLFKLAANSPESVVLPYGAQSRIAGIAVKDGSVYYVDESNSYNGNGGFGSLFGAPRPGGTVRRVAAGTSSPTVVPFSGFQGLSGVTVDGGRVYVTDSGHKQVLSLPVDAPQMPPAAGSLNLPFGS